MGFINLHGHTAFSNLRLIDAVVHPEDLVDRAYELGHAGVAITDHASLSGHVKILAHLKKRRKQNPNDERWQNFKLILGEEIYLTRNGLNKDNFITGEDKYYHFILLAKDEVGHRQIRQLSSRAWGRSWYRFMRRVPTYYSDLSEIIGENKGHVIGSSACLGSKLGQTILDAEKYRGKDEEVYQEKMDYLRSWIEWMVDVFGEGNFFLERQPSLNKEQWIVNRAIEQLSVETGMPTIITLDAHYVRKEDRPIHKAYLNSKDGEREVDDFYESAYMMGEEEILSYFARADEKFGALVEGARTQDIVARDMANTLSLVGSRVKEYDLAHSPIIPQGTIDWQSVDRFSPLVVNGKEYKYINKMATSPYEQDQYFIAKVMQGLNKRVPVEVLENRLDEYYSRIDIECEELWEISEKMGERMSAYSTLVAEIIDVIWTEGDSLVGVGRGSSVAFLTNYLLGIVQVDVLRAEANIPHWRYVNRDRVSLPDVDLDIESSKRQRVMNALKKRFGADKVINIATFGTEQSKSALRTAARGVGVDDDTATYLASLIPVERGFNWSLHDTFYGNEEEGRKPVARFVSEMTYTYPELWAVAQRIEGLVRQSGIHAAGVLISNDPIYQHNATMKSPDGRTISQFDLGDTEYMGLVKFDLLSVDVLDRIRVMMELLIEHGYVERKATLKETYLSILDPQNTSIIEYDNPAIWELASSGTVPNLFQWMTPVGGDAIKRVKPKNIAEMAMVNSLMRLMASEGEMPMDTFLRHRTDPSQWEQELSRAGLSNAEKDLMRKHLGSHFGVAESQESIMLLTMDEKVAGFSVSEADSTRKSIAKKNPADFEKMEKFFFEKGKKLGTSQALLEYVWYTQARRQRGYSFSVAHTYVYSIIALQQLNLAHKYPMLLWETANLIVDSGGLEEAEEELEAIVDDDGSEIEVVETSEEEEEEEEVVEEVKAKVKAVDYGKISTALGKLVSRGVDISPPDINYSEYTFSPDILNNTIVFGLRGIAKINEKVIAEIVANRPYSSLDDLLSKVKLNKPQVISLIKSGALDKIRGRSREEIMREYVDSVSDTKKTLNLRNMQMLIEMGFIPEEMDFYRKLFNFNKYLKKFKSGIYYQLDDQAMRFFEEHYDNGVLISQEDGSIAIEQKVWDKTYTKGMDPMRNYIKENLDELLTKVNNRLTGEMWSKYASGSISKWEMDSLSFYYHEHELSGVDFLSYGIEDFHSKPEEPEIDRFIHIKGQPVPIFKLYRIAGTVLNRDKLKKIVTILTPTGVVNVRIWQNQFVKYDRQLSERLPNGKKKVIEKSWFTRGNKVMFTGIRRGDNFIPKVYRNGEYKYPVELIDEILEDGTLLLRGEREEQ